MKVGFSTYFFTKKPLPSIVDEILDSGVSAIELTYEIPQFFEYKNGDFVARLKRLKERGVSLSMHGPFQETNLGSFHEEIRRFSMERILSAATLAGNIGCDILVIHPCYTMVHPAAREIREKTRNNFIEDLARVTEYARDAGVQIALENIPVHFFFFHELNQFRDIAESVPGIGMALDIGHAYIMKRQQGETDPEGAILRDIGATGIENIIHIHLHNNGGVKDDHFFLNGDMDMARVINGIMEMGYTGRFAIESHDMEDHGMDPVMKKIETMTGNR